MQKPGAITPAHSGHTMQINRQQSPASISRWHAVHQLPLTAGRQYRSRHGCYRPGNQPEAATAHQSGVPPDCYPRTAAPAPASSRGYGGLIALHQTPHDGLLPPARPVAPDEGSQYTRADVSPPDAAPASRQLSPPTCGRDDGPDRGGLRYYRQSSIPADRSWPAIAADVFRSGCYQAAPQSAPAAIQLPLSHFPATGRRTAAVVRFATEHRQSAASLTSAPTAQPSYLLPRSCGPQ